MQDVHLGDTEISGPLLLVPLRMPGARGSSGMQGRSPSADANLPQTITAPYWALGAHRKNTPPASTETAMVLPAHKYHCFLPIHLFSYFVLAVQVRILQGKEMCCKNP